MVGDVGGFGRFSRYPSRLYVRGTTTMMIMIILMMMMRKKHWLIFGYCPLEVPWHNCIACAYASEHATPFRGLSVPLNSSVLRTDLVSVWFIVSFP